jgi:cytochrome c biogenesis factor
MGVTRYQMTDRVTAAATLDIDRRGRPVGLVTSERRQYFGLMGQPIGNPVTKVGIHRGVFEDIRVVFREATRNEEALYQVRVVPFVSLLWLGVAVLLAGGLVLALGLRD